MPGTKEHEGNRNYFGPQRIAEARQDSIAQSLSRIAKLRQKSVALQKGLQVNLDFEDHKASFFRVYQDEDQAQTALVLLNKGSEETTIAVDRWLSSGSWRDAFSGERLSVAAAGDDLSLNLPANGVRVLLFDGPVNNRDLVERLSQLQQR